MSRRTGRDPERDPEEDPQPEVEVAAATSAIAGLRRQLRRLGTIDQPAIRRELRKLDELISSLIEQAGRTGRHRRQGGKPPGGGDGEPPDPAAARTPAEFVTVLWQYRAWQGNPTWRTMAANARQIVVHSTIYTAMRGRDLPTLEVVKAVILGCRGGQDDLDAFTSAWHRIHAASTSGQDDAGLLPAPVPGLQLTTTP